MSPYVKPDPTVEIQIKYDGVDITADCVIAECWFISRANGVAGDAQVVIRDDAQLMTFIPGKTLELYLDGVRQWDGYAIQRKHNYWFEGHTANCYPCPHITPRKHILIGADRNILFERRVLYNKVTPEFGLPEEPWPAGTMDEEVIEQSIALYLDDVDGIDYTTKVETVAAVDPYVDFEVRGPSNMFGDMMREISQEVGAVFYIDPDRYLVYTDVNNPDAPFILTDQPTVAGEVGYRDMTVLYDGTRLINDAMIWGAGQGSAQIVFKRVTDTNPDWGEYDERGSLEIHGRWQNANGFRSQVWNPGTIERMANSIVYGSPANKRGHKDDRVVVECTLYTPGLRVAQKVEFVSNSHEFTDVIPVRNLRISFPTDHNVKYEARLSHELDEPWTIIENLPLPEDGEHKTICTTPVVEPIGIKLYGPQGLVDPHDDLLLADTHTSQIGLVDSTIAIINGDGYPPNKLTFYGDNSYQSRELDTGDPYVEFTYIYADRYWYNNGDGDIQVPGERIYEWINRYTAYQSPLNLTHPGFPVRAIVEVTMTMAGEQADRDVIGHLFPFPSIERVGDEPAGPHWVIFGPLIPSRNFRPPHTNPEVYASAEMMAGDTVVRTFEMVMNHSTYFMLGVDFNEINPTTGKEWHSRPRVSTNVNITWEDYGPGNYLVIKPPNMDGQDCLEQASLGYTCETAIRVAGLKYRVRQPYALNTLLITVDGMVLAGRGIEYTETDPRLGEFVLEEEPDGDVEACYDISAYLGDLPPPEVLFILPVSDRIVGSFGTHESGWGDYYWHGQYFAHFHNGVDFASPIGTPVYAAADGFVGWEDQVAGGLMIHIYHDFYGFRTTYAHLSNRIVEDGDLVLQGQIIAYTGDTGTVSGPHLHWGLVCRGSPEDPLPYTTYQPQNIFVPPGPVGVFPE